MEILLTILYIFVLISVIYVMGYVIFYLFAVLSSPFYIAYKAVTTSGSEKDKYLDSLKGLLLLSVLFYILIKFIF